MRQETNLTGKWQFVGAEKFNGIEWQEAAYVDQMIWEFRPQYSGENKTIGNIIESTPSEAPIEMAYVYTNDDNLLKIEIFTDNVTGKEDKSEADFYDVTFCTDQITNRPTIYINILTQEGCPLPYFRYILQQVEQ